jgi:thermostable 8-oxoguanine DNA glycosylase
MIDPYNITDYNRNKYEDEEFILFCVCVAGKTAKQISSALEDFLKPCKDKNISPFGLIREYNKKDILLLKIKASRLGKHNLLLKAFSQLSESNYNLKKCSIEDLEKICGIGPKSARFFILHSRPSQNIAVLDVHILSHLRENGYPKMPKQTPQSSRMYMEIEKIFISEARKNRMSVADYDLMIWKSRARSI